MVCGYFYCSVNYFGNMWLFWVGVIVNCFLFFRDFDKLVLNNEVIVELSDMYIFYNKRKKVDNRFYDDLFFFGCDCVCFKRKRIEKFFVCLVSNRC